MNEAEPSALDEDVIPAKNDDGRRWGFVENGKWVELPKVPMLLANFGPPPFDVTLPHTGEVRRIIHDPSEAV